MSDEYYILQALGEAEKAGQEGEVPVGAVVVEKGKIISRASNRPKGSHDPSAHAEMLALRKACKMKSNYRLLGCDLYVTLEPCAMCVGAIIQARLRRLVFGAYDPKTGAVVSVFRFPFETMNHQVEITGGILAERCGAILKDFFRDRR